MHGIDSVVEDGNGPRQQKSAVGRHRRSDPYRGRHRPTDGRLYRRLPDRAVAAAAIAMCFGLVTIRVVSFGEHGPAEPDPPAAAAAILDQRTRSAQDASRSGRDRPQAPPTDAEPPTDTAGEALFEKAGTTPAERGKADTNAAEATQEGATQEGATQEGATGGRSTQEGATKNTGKQSRPRPVGGLSQQQMDHAAVIVRVGQEAGLPKRAYVIAIATALQESNLRNLTNDTMPESFNYRNDGSGWDHDSVGLFQQRSSTGWGTVAQLMDPAYSAGAFYAALRNVAGWQDMPVTRAAQAVQVSAFPDAYAKHEPLATSIVDALTE